MERLFLRWTSPGVHLFRSAICVKPSNRLVFVLTSRFARGSAVSTLKGGSPRARPESGRDGRGSLSDGGEGVGLQQKTGRRGLLPERGGLALPPGQPARAHDARRRLPGRARQAPSGCSSCRSRSAKGWRRSTRWSSATRCATWVKLGFAKEGNIPGFYKRSDAFLLGCTVPPPGRAKTLDSHARSTRCPRRAKSASTVAERGRRPRADDAGPGADGADHPHGEEAPEGLRQGGPAGEGRAGEPRPRRARRWPRRFEDGRALTAFEPFGRDAERRYFVATARGGFELYASTESQACFGNAYLELLQRRGTRPRSSRPPARSRPSATSSWPRGS